MEDKTETTPQKRFPKWAMILLIVFGTLVLLITAGAIWIYTSLHTTYTAIQEPVMVQEIGEHPANQCQRWSSVWMGVYDGKLYFCPRNPGRAAIKLDGYVCTFADDGAQKICYLETEYPRYFMYLDNRLYYGYGGLNMCDLQTGEVRTELADRMGALLYTAADGSAYFLHSWDNYAPVELSAQMCVHIRDGVVVEDGVSLPEECGYRLGDNTYFVLPNNGWNADGGFHAVFTLQEDGSLELIEELHKSNWTTTMIPVENGLLIHNAESKGALYYIDETGAIRCLFGTEGFAVKSAVTVVGSDVYFSLDRWEEEYGFYQLRHFENDTIPGTYRISLKDFSTEKISDEIYDGLYNFDDTCLYACYKRSIYRLDLDGNVQKVLLKVKD